MKSIQEELACRRLPDLMSLKGQKIVTEQDWADKCSEMRRILSQELYGFPPFRECRTEGRMVKESADSYGGKARSQTILLQLGTSRGVCSFPFELTLPKAVKCPPVFLSITGYPVNYLTEELIDNGYAVASVFYQDIMPDRPEAELEGIGRIIEKIPYIGWGKIAMWAYGVNRITDYLMTREFIDTGRIAVAGHSRLGKTALLCGAMDSRYSLIISAGSGAGGAALFRGKRGEQIEDLSRHWFCGNISKYDCHPEQLPFDQHFLLALAAPRRLYISGASRDDWADPFSEFLSCAAASPAYEFLGLKGLVHHGFPDCGQLLHDGHIAYHVREGTHAMTREDWHAYMRYRERWHV